MTLVFLRPHPWTNDGSAVRKTIVFCCPVCCSYWKEVAFSAPKWLQSGLTSCESMKHWCFYVFFNDLSLTPPADWQKKELLRPNTYVAKHTLPTIGRRAYHEPCEVGTVELQSFSLFRRHGKLQNLQCRASSVWLWASLEPRENAKVKWEVMSPRSIYSFFRPGGIISFPYCTGMIWHATA